MKKSLSVYLSFVLSLFVLSAVFIGCNKDDEDDTAAISGNSITATVSGVGNMVDSVYLIAYKSGFDEKILTKAEFKNNQFTIKLPETVSSQDFESLSSDMPSGVKLSDPSVKICEADLIGYKNRVMIGDFEYGNLDGDNEIYVYFWYADKDVSITGTDANDDYTEQYNCHLKKGWNYVADVYIGEGSNKKPIYSCTTSIPGGLKWSFDTH